MSPPHRLREASLGGFIKPDLSLLLQLLQMHLTVVYLSDTSLFKRGSPQELAWGASSGLEDKRQPCLVCTCQVSSYLISQGPYGTLLAHFLLTGAMIA
jgi:hypothetical protein